MLKWKYSLWIWIWWNFIAFILFQARAVYILLLEFRLKTNKLNFELCISDKETATVIDKGVYIIRSEEEPKT